MYYNKKIKKEHKRIYLLHIESEDIKSIEKVDKLGLANAREAGWASLNEPRSSKYEKLRGKSIHFCNKIK